MKRLIKILNNINDLVEKYDTTSELEQLIKQYLYNHQIIKSFFQDYYFLGAQVPNINNTIWYNVDRYQHNSTIYLMINRHKFLIKK